MGSSEGRVRAMGEQKDPTYIGFSSIADQYQRKVSAVPYLNSQLSTLIRPLSNEASSERYVDD